MRKEKKEEGLEAEVKSGKERVRTRKRGWKCGKEREMGKGR